MAGYFDILRQFFGDHGYADAVEAARVMAADGVTATDVKNVAKAYKDGTLVGGSAGVTSFNTRTGAITLSKSDVTATGLAAADVGAAATSHAHGDYVQAFNGGAEGIVTATIGTVTYTPDLSQGNHFALTTTGTPTINMPTVTAGRFYAFSMRLIQPDTLAHSVIWDAKVTWVSGQAPQRAQGTVGAYDIYTFMTEDGGTTWLGLHITAQMKVGANYLQWSEMAAPSAPPAGSVNVYMDSTDHVLYAMTSSGSKRAMTVTVSTTAPTSPAVGQLWVDTN